MAPRVGPVCGAGSDRTAGNRTVKVILVSMLLWVPQMTHYEATTVKTLFGSVPAWLSACSLD
jgi:hypothetical protein